MFTKKPQDIKKSTSKIQDIKKDSATRLKHLKTILENVDSEEAKNIFESNYSHVYYILYDTFVQAENNLKQRELSFHLVHKTHREELDASLWLLSKILCLLPELLAKRWQVHSISRVIAKLIHHGNSSKLRKDGVRYFLLWYQCLAENAPQHVHAMFNELIPGVTIPHKNFSGPGELEFNDILNHPNLKGELGTSVFHDTNSHPVQSAEVTPLLLPSSNERTAVPDPKDGLEMLLECMVQSSGCLKWRENSPQKHIKCFNFLLQRFREVYLPVLCPNFDHSITVYEPRLDLPVMRAISKKEEVMSSCVVVLVNWVAKYTHDKLMTTKVDNVQVEDDFGENLRMMGYTQPHLVRDVLYASRENINFVHEVYRQAFLLGYTSKAQIEAMRIAISIYKEWISGDPPPFLLEPDEIYTGEREIAPSRQRLRTDSYLGAVGKENIIRAGLQNILQVFVTNAVNVFMVQTSHLNIHFQSKSKEGGFTTPLDEQTDVCKRVLNIYRTMVMKTRMDPRTWEQLLLVLLQVTSIILSQATPNSKKNLGGRLAQPIFQTLIVTWIRAHTNVVVNPNMWDKFLKVLTTLTHREELIVEWDKTMQTLTRVMARQVYNLNLLELPLDRLAEQKGKRRRAFQNSSISTSDAAPTSPPTMSNTKISESERPINNLRHHIPGTPSLNRSYSEGSLASIRKSRGRRRIKHQQIAALPPNVEHSLTRILSNTSTHLSISAETLNNSIMIQAPSNGTLRRAVSLDSIRAERVTEGDNEHNSRSPSPTASSGIEGGSIKDSPMQIDNIGGDSSSIDTQDEMPSYSSDKRSILNGGTAKGWLPDVAAVMWKRMLGMLGDVNKILNPKLHAQVFKYLVNMTECLIKIRLNQGISTDNHSTPPPASVVPPVSIITPWCYGALSLDAQYQQGKLYAMQILCMVAKQGIALGNDQLPLFYLVLHQSLTGEDRAMVFTVLRHLGGARFLSLLLPGHSLLLLDFVHASTVVLTSSEVGVHIPRSEVAGLLGSLLCFPKTSLPGPVLQPSEPHVDLMECPDLQEHVLNIVLRCARREPSARARCIAICSLAHWIVQNCQQHINNSREPLNARITEAMQVILQALQFKHRTIARIAIESLRLCAEKGKVLAKIETLIPIIINAVCVSLEIQNVRNPRESDKVVLTSLLLCLGEFCMSIPTKLLLKPKSSDSDETLILAVLKVTHQLSKGNYNNHIRLFTPDEDFDQTITMDDLQEQLSFDESYQTAETIEKCQAAIKLCAKTVNMHLVTNLSHFPIGIGASRLSSLVDEQDDLGTAGGSGGTVQRKTSENNRDSIDLNANVVLAAPNIQLFMLNPELVASFIELPTLKLPGGGITAGIITASKQVRLLLRDINGKACWDACILYREPKLSRDSVDSAYHTPSSTSLEKGPFFTDYKDKGPPQFFAKLAGRNYGFSSNGDSMMSTVGLPMSPLRHTLRHRPPNQLPVASEIAPDLDQLDDLLQYIGHTSPECLTSTGHPLNSAAASPLSPNQEAQTITTILNQRSMESDYLARQSMQSNNCFTICSSTGGSNLTSLNYSYGTKSLVDEPDSGDAKSGSFYSERDELLPFHYCRLLFSQLGLAGWERRRKTHLLKRNDKLLRELRNLDGQRCRETHKVAVIYVANGQEDKNSILKNSCGSSAYEMFVSALGWEIELETHNGFLGGLPRQGCGSTAPYYATPFLEIIYHVATRMPTDSSEAILNKTRHLGNDEVHIVWSEHYRDYRRDILPTEFCDVLIIIYPLKSGLFRVVVSRKPDVPWFGPLSDESVVGGACLASLIRATAINASRAKRMSLPFYQQFYEERNRSLEVVSSRHKEPTTYEEFTARLYCPVPGSNSSSVASSTAAALIDHQKIKRSSTKNFYNHPEITTSSREIQPPMHSVSLDQPSPRPLKKLHHPFKVQKKTHSNMLTTSSQQAQINTTPPDSPTAPVRKFK